MIKTFAIKATEVDAFEAASYIAKQSTILKELHQENSAESLARWENVQELLNAAKEFVEDPDNDANTLDAFLAEISLFTDQDEQQDDPDFVTLMSIHAAKGLEFPSLFVVGLEEELFPNLMALQSRADLEEERRLFYVAVTRAKERLTLSYAKSRYRYGQLQYNEPSRFVQEMDDDHITYPTKRRQAVPVEGGRALGRNVSPISGARGRRKPMLSSNFESDDLTNLTAGNRVEHNKFGAGKSLGCRWERARTEGYGVF